jgi:hypothetical protein
MQKKNDDIVYLTLIDFLIQLIFFSLFIFVIYNNEKLSHIPTYIPPSWVNDKTYAPILEGYGPFIRADNVKKFEEIWKYLKTQKDLDNLVSALNTAKSINELKKGADIINKGGGADKVEKKILGKKSCLEDGSTSSIFKFDVESDLITVISISPIGADELKKRNVTLKEGDKISRAQIGSKFKDFNQQSCIYFVDYIKHTDSEQMRFEVEKNFGIHRIDALN